MKLESPPKVKFTKDVFSDYFDGKYEDFLKKTDFKYLYWDELKHLKDLPYNNPQKAWSLIKLFRQGNFQKISFGGTTFRYSLTTQIQKNNHDFDLKLMGGLFKSPITDYDKEEFLKNSILQEAIASSQIEGAATTTKVALDMLKSGRVPRNESEQMIFNNLRAINYIKGELGVSLSKTMIVELHKIMTANTSAEYCSGGYRKDQIFIQDHIDGEIAHTPPEFNKVDSFMEDLIKFTNQEEEFVHPIVKASILHFMIGYIHPFMDGNGRTARAIFYWYLMKKDYSLIENISISKVIFNSRVQYDKAFLKTEKDVNDLTYFINYSIKNLRIAFESLIKYRDEKKREQEKGSIIAYKLLKRGFSKRQADLIGYFFSKPNRTIDISLYSKKNDIVRQTARKDLNELISHGLLKEEKRGRTILFSLTGQQKVKDYLDKPPH